MPTDTKPPTRMGKKELQDALLALGYTNEQLLDGEGKKLKRPALLEKLQAHKQGEEGLAVLSTVQEEDDDTGVVVGPDAKDLTDDFGEPLVVEDTDPPTPSDPGWTQYVLGKFLEDEVDGQNPRVEGLRRVAGELVGELIEEGCDLVAAPTEENRFRACAKAWGVFLTPEGREKRFEALADAHSENCFEDYATYLVAMADTRAKGRMYRNALCLRRVVAAEEVSKTVATAADIQQGGPIHTSQISMIRLISDRHGFKISEVLDGLAITYELNDQTGDVNLQSLSYEDALAAASEMRKMKEQKGDK
ncbi:MAG: hypothetical protein DRJ03_00360 [Chloroflexi bacterium]|nr:MAG: hypothetical protein DRJ03_00360 [Chloroflexota bacterium]